MSLRLLFAGLLMMLPFPAFADVTATYSAGKDSLVVEADEGGNFRAGVADKFAILRLDGVDYVLVPDAAGDLKVARFADVLALVAGQLKGQGGDEMPAMVFEMKPGAEESVAGYAGMMWLFGPQPAPGKEARKPLEIVLSGDPVLAPIGLVFRHLVELGNPLIGTMFGGGAGNFATASAELLGKGAPLRVGPVLKLESVATTEIAASRFTLPGPVLEPVEFLQAVSPSEGGGLTPLP